MSIENIYNLGDDAFSNLFKVIISEDEEQKFQLRTQNINIPSAGHATYTIDYMQYQIDKIAPKIEQTREVSMQLRIDANWEVYNWLRDKRNAALHPTTGVVNSLPDIEFQVTVKPVDTNGDPIDGSPEWIFYHCWVKTLPDISFDYGSSDPINIDVTIGFIYMSDDGSTPSSA